MDCYSAFKQRLILDDVHHTVIAVLSVPLIPVTIFTNLAVIVSLVKTKHLHRSQSNLFIFALSISDCLLGVLTLPGFVMLFTIHRTTRSCILEQLIQFMVNFNAHVSGSIIILIALDRYLNLDPDLKRINGLGRWLTTASGFRISMGICVLFSVISSVVAAIDYEDRRIPDSISAAIDIILFFLLCGLYHRLYRKIKRFARKAHDMKLYSNHESRPVYLKQVTKTVLFLLLGIAFCYLPFFIVNVTLTFVRQKSTLKQLRFAFYLTLVILFFNSTFNALIILYRNKALFDFVTSKIFCCRIGTQPKLNRITVKNNIENFERKSMKKSRKKSEDHREQVIKDGHDGTVNPGDVRKDDS